MKTEKLNEFAFPVENSMGDRGMTLLDYFAAKAMQGHIANVNYMKALVEMKKHKKAIDCLCKDSYMVAKTMLKERTKNL